MTAGRVDCEAWIGWYAVSRPLYKTLGAVILVHAGNMSAHLIMSLMVQRRETLGKIQHVLHPVQHCL